MEGLVPLSLACRPGLQQSRCGGHGGLTQPRGSHPPFSGAVSRTQPLPRGLLPSPGEVTRSQIGSFLNHRTVCSAQAALRHRPADTHTGILTPPPSASRSFLGQREDAELPGSWERCLEGAALGLEDSHRLLAGCFWNRPVDDSSSQPSSGLILVLRGGCCLGLAGTTRGRGPQRGHSSAP